MRHWFATSSNHSIDTFGNRHISASAREDAPRSIANMVSILAFTPVGVGIPHATCRVVFTTTTAECNRNVLQSHGLVAWNMRESEDTHTHTLRRQSHHSKHRYGTALTYSFMIYVKTVPYLNNTLTFTSFFWGFKDAGDSIFARVVVNWVAAHEN